MCAQAGCGPSVADVTGTVTYKGTPLKYGSVTIYSSTGQPAQGRIEPDGKYTIKHCPTGEARVSVHCIDEEAALASTKAMFKGRDDKNVAKGGQPGKMPIEQKSEIPVKYNNPATSGLTVHVAPSVTTRDLELK
jgi:hypothetical protein